MRYPPKSLENHFFARFSIQCSNFAERWFPDSWVFAALAVLIVSFGALFIEAKPLDIGIAFGNGFWTLIPFTLQMAFVVIGGYVVASSKPATELIEKLVNLPKNGKWAITLVAFVSMAASLLNWGLSLVFAGLLVKALARRSDIRMDYRAAGAAAYLGLGAVWALGLSSSAAQLQANKASLPPAIYSITGVIPFTDTIFLWQSGVLLLSLIVASLFVAYFSAPTDANAKTAGDCSVDVSLPKTEITSKENSRPGEYLENSPLLILFMCTLGALFIFNGWGTPSLDSKKFFKCC